ncbi:ABC transporter permease [Salisediminibacterium beveridgei]|uniref:Putative transport permease yfiM n=1 Tax=Salisediminibacterium beveridgei TaxID=632773 RepID=A0A1D7QTI0_9BACI|nr:ABC transporter permease [Salisediminibacterium beveridgei]AOM82285.1 Putative transport permease yfiM [Salisediminibacterium beveridgei]
MLTYIVKDLKLLLRNRTELLLLFAMPLILIAILGFALRGLLTGGGEALDIDVALIDLDDRQGAQEQLLEDLSASGMPEDAIDELSRSLQEISPARMLDQLLESDEMSGMITIHREEETEAALNGLEENRYNAVIEVPEHFTYDSLVLMIIGEGDGSSLQLTIQDEQSIYGRVMHDILNRFTETFNLETAIAREIAEEPERSMTELGQIETLTSYDPINSQQYYTAGMAVMFVLYTAATIASFANVERKSHVLDRILLSGTGAVSYLSGKWLSAMLIAFLQLIVLFGLSALVFQTFPQSSPSFWLGIVLISLVMAMSVGALGALVSAITIRQKSNAAANVFSGGVVALMAFTGGSFFPTEGLPGIIRTVGDLTPNGQGMTLYLRWIQGFEMSELLPSIYRLLLICVLLTVLAAGLYPKDKGVKG